MAVAVVVALLLLLFLVRVVGRTVAIRDRTRCATRLSALALASLQYADERGAHPHVRGSAELDGDFGTGDSLRAQRALVSLGYLDDPALLVCPSSGDAAAPFAPEAASDPRRWFWGGTVLPAAGPSPVVDAHQDPRLDETRECSNGWVRRRLSTTSHSAPLVSDRALRRSDQPIGCHPDGWSVAFTDGSTAWVSAEGAEAWRLRATTDPARDGYLALREDVPAP